MTGLASPGRRFVSYGWLIRPGDWVDDAACARDYFPDMWFPNPHARGLDAKIVCLGCPVRGECLAYALAHKELAGIWGGRTENEREAIRRQWRHNTRKARKP